MEMSEIHERLLPTGKIIYSEWDITS